MTKSTRLVRASALVFSLASFAFDCGSPEYEDDALVINQTDDRIEVKIRRLTVDCVEIRSDQVPLLTRSDFAPVEVDKIDARSLEVLQATPYHDCTTELLWLEVGDFAGLLRWPRLDNIDLHNDDIGAKLFSRAVLIEGTKANALVSVGEEIEVFDLPPEGPPTLPPPLQ